MMFKKALTGFMIIVASTQVQAVRMIQTIPDIEQSTDYSCGVAALSAVLAHYGIEASEEDLMEETKINPETGVALGEIVKSATIRGVKAVSVENASLIQLEEALLKGQLTIILGQAWRGKRRWWQSSSWDKEWDAGHYLVVIGMDAANIYFEDPWISGNRGLIPKKEFLTRWHGPSDTDALTQRQAIFFEGTPDNTVAPLDLISIPIN